MKCTLWRRKKKGKGSRDGAPKNILKTAPLTLAINACKDVARNLWFGSVGLNLPEFACLISCSIVANHYYFNVLKQCSLEIYKRKHGYRNKHGFRNFQCARHSLVSSFYCIGRKKFRNRRLENVILNLIFANTKPHFANLVTRTCRKRVRRSFVSKIYYGPTMVGLEKNFQNGGSPIAGKHYFEIDLCTYSIL